MTDEKRKFKITEDITDVNNYEENIKSINTLTNYIYENHKLINIDDIIKINILTTIKQYCKDNRIKLKNKKIESIPLLFIIMFNIPIPIFGYQFKQIQKTYKKLGMISVCDRFFNYQQIERLKIIKYNSFHNEKIVYFYKPKYYILDNDICFVYEKNIFKYSKSKI